MNMPVTNSSTEAATLVALLRKRAIDQPNQQAYIFLPNGETGEEVGYTYAELDRQARAIATRLQLLGMVGERALLLFPPGLEYIAAFFGCLYAGVTAVPVYPPRANKPVERLQAIVSDTQAKVALSTSVILAASERWLAHTSELQRLEWLATDTIEGEEAHNWHDPEITGETLAFLQYTSGSTSTPKGVMLVHSNLLHNSALIYQGFELTPESRGVSWLPPYHDMGLIGGILQPLYSGIPVTLMSPIAFLQNPFRWLQAISHSGATVSGGPNFAYELCVRKITSEQRATLDLSSWRVAFCGAEPIRYETLQRFAETFKSCGFRQETFYPCYGLAEATLIVSGGKQAHPPLVRRFQRSELEQRRAVAVSTESSPSGSSSQELVGCGKALGGQRLLIVDPERGVRCSDEQIGEIWVAGPSVAKGYWKRSEETTSTFQAHLTDTGEGPFLRTGDLGFLQNGELFVTGRIKDLVIIRGRNYYPQDLELAAERGHPGLRPGSGAAFSIEKDGEERLVIAQEVDRHHQNADVEEIASAVRRAISEDYELQVYGVVLLKTGSLPKTSSGKVQRYLCRERFLSGELNTVGSSILDSEPGEGTVQRAEEPSTESHFIKKALQAVSDSAARQQLLTLYLQEQASHILRTAQSQVDVERPLGSFGIDSLMAVELKNEIETSLGLVLPITTLLEDVTIRQLAADLLAQLEGGVQGSGQSRIPVAEQRSEYPLSVGQRALWFLYRLAPNSAAYNIVSAVTIRSELDITAMRRTFVQLIERHTPLRSVVVTRQGEPFQRIQPASELHFSEEDASDWDEATLHKRLAEEAHRPFELERGPLLRVSLFTRAPQEHILLLTVHHIVSDFWSLVVLMRELGVLYSAERVHGSAELPPLKASYADYVSWQENLLAGAEGERHWAYWQKQLAGELPALQLPTDHPRPVTQTYHGASFSFTLTPELTERLKLLARQENVTLYMILLAAFQVLLYRHTGQDDILVGTPSAGRNRAQFSDLIGYFVNPIVLRARLSRKNAFKDFLEQVRQTALDAFEHQDYPFPLLVERLQPRRDASRSPLFQAMFALQKAPSLGGDDLAAFALGKSGVRLSQGDLEVESLTVEQQIAQFDVSLMVADVHDELVNLIQYNTDLFEEETIEQLAQHWQVLLEGVVEDPQCPIGRLPLLSEGEREHLLRGWNQTQREYPPASCIHQLVQEQVARQPEAPALIAGAHKVSYGELERRANQLGHRLQELGVGPEVLVGLCLERSVELVLSMLGILKAGGAYVPLDPNYPQERLTFMLQDTQAPVVVTQQRLRERFAGQPVEVVCLDEEEERLAGYPQEAPSSGVGAQNLAYVIYTSGSTGRPKGVAIEHRNTVALLRWSAETFTADELRDVLAGTSTNFDISVFEIFLPLICGGTIILAENTLYLSSLAAAKQVTLVNTVPSVMIELLRTNSLSPSVRVVNLAGEPLTNALAQKVYQQKSVEKVYNLYGPSEDTTYSTFALIQRDATNEPSIGHPIANSFAYLLDEEGEPVPVGVAGELYLGGAGVARGYLQRAELSAEKFVPDPFSGQAGSRLYRTGDLARYRKDGSLEFLGRIDHQVKLRGYRIELGEIETVLSQHAGIGEAVVVVREEAGNKQLVAYVAAQAGQELSVETLRAYLKEQLPEYMVPSSLMVLEALPLTPNGKIDRRALPRPPEEHGSEYVAPRSETEEVVARIWCEVLGVSQVGIYDNFFDLGGHSLLATQIVARVCETIQLELPLSRFFEAQNVADLAAIVEEAKETQGEYELDRIVPISRGKKNIDRLFQEIEELEGLPDGETVAAGDVQTHQGRASEGDI